MIDAELLKRNNGTNFSSKVYKKWYMCIICALLVIFTIVIIRFMLKHSQKESSSIVTCNGNTNLVNCSISALNINSNNEYSNSETCIAPKGIFGPKCTSVYELKELFSDVLISYKVHAVVDTPVFCKFLGMACYDHNVACCFTMHPRTNSGLPIWFGPNTLIWGKYTAKPQIQCFSNVLSTALVWSWGLSPRSGLGCFNGTNCELMTC